MPSSPMTHACPEHDRAVDVLDVLVEPDARIGLGQELLEQGARSGCAHPAAAYWRGPSAGRVADLHHGGYCFPLIVVTSMKIGG